MRMGKTSRSQDRQHEQWVRYPLGFVLNTSLLASSLSILLQLAAGNDDLYTLLLRAIVVFIGFAVAGSVLMVVVVSVLHRIKQEELRQQARLAEEEQLAAMLSASNADRASMNAQAQTTTMENSPTG